MLCTTFKKLSEDTWEQIDLSKTAGYQLKEETLTDQNLLQLKIKHPTEILIRAFNKHEEGRNGADWEWWLTDGNEWVGFRVQAKIINIETDRFEHLHYQAKTSVPQSRKLIEQSKPIGEKPRVPIYCMFLSTEKFDPAALKSAPEFYGCSIMSAYTVAVLRDSGTDDVVSLQAYLIPWHELVCQKPAISFAEHIDRFLVERLDQGILDVRFYITDEPPAYVSALLVNNNHTVENEYGNPDLAGVMVAKLYNNTE
jgi:hypothetical protein